MMIRLIGVALLAVSAGALWLLRQIVESTPQNMLGVAVGMVVVTTGIAGANLLIVGPRLFRSTRVD